MNAWSVQRVKGAGPLRYTYPRLLDERHVSGFTLARNTAHAAIIDAMLGEGGGQLKREVHGTGGDSESTREACALTLQKTLFLSLIVSPVMPPGEKHVALQPVDVQSTFWKKKKVGRGGVIEEAFVAHVFTSGREKRNKLYRPEAEGLRTTAAAPFRNRCRSCL